jgi:hypothetical protein
MDGSNRSFDERPSKTDVLPLRFRVVERCVWAVAIAFAILIGVAVMYVAQPRFDADRDDADCEQMLVWATAQKLAIGSHPDLALPVSLSAISADGKVDVEILADGRTVLFFKTSFFPHDNFYGVVYSSAPFKPAEIDKDEFGQPTFNIETPTCRLCNVAIWKKVSERHYVMLFNLG